MLFVVSQEAHVA